MLIYMLILFILFYLVLLILFFICLLSFVCLLCELFTEPHLLLAEGFRTEDDKPIKLK